MKIGDQFRHYKGGIYTIVDLARCAETGSKMIIYQGDDGSKWVHTERNFLKPLRFKLVTNGSKS